MTLLCQGCGIHFEPYRHQVYCTPTCRRKTSVKQWSQKPNYPEWKSWQHLRDRCNNPRHHAYDRYGGRGIAVCARWDSFDLFFEDMGKRPSPKHSIDRIDNDRNYQPDNCRWATKTEQSRNRSGTFTSEQDRVLRDGIAKKLCFRAIGVLMGKTYGAVSARAYRLGLKSEWEQNRPRHAPHHGDQHDQT